ncbi:MAG: PASTA domain-containing protein [Alistipes sp.]|nr:PASTA domain-containing protein [Alistipes sp.]
MENRSVSPRRAGRKSQKQSLWAQLKSRPLLYHAVLIVLTLVAIIVLSSLLMMVITRHGTHRTVPDFTGVKIDQARNEAKDKALEIIINDSLFVPAYEGGIVLDQLPKGGAEVKAGRKVYVTINSFREKMVKVPYVAGRSLRQAKNMLEVAGLGIEKLVYVEDIATNYVLAEIVDGRELSEQSNVELEMGSGVVLKVGVDAEKNSTIVPKAIGQSLQSAKSRLWEQGLNVGKVNFDEDINLLNQKNARVYRQSLGHNTTTTLGTSVSLWLTLDQEKIDKSSAASDKIAHELEEERLRLEQERQDSLDRVEAAGGNPIFEALQESSSASKSTVVESEEEEWF